MRPWPITGSSWGPCIVPAMATAKKRSTKSTAASPKAAEKTASSRATKPGTKSAPARASGNKKAAAQKPATQKAAAAKAAPSAKATRSPKPAAAAKPAGSSRPAAAAKPAAAGQAAKGAGKAGQAGKSAGTGTSARAKVIDAVGKAAKAARKVAERVSAGKGRTSRAAAGDAALFAPLTDGERAEALRLLTEDQRLSSMANVGRYRVIAVEPLVAKSPEVANHRLARAVVYDYSSERSVDATIDLDTGKVVHLTMARTQPMLSREEEDAAIAIALADEQVTSKLAPGDQPTVAMHYWSRRDTSLAYSRRAAAVLLGQPRGATSLIAVVDLLDNLVCEIVPAAEW